MFHVGQARHEMRVSKHEALKPVRPLLDLGFLELNVLAGNRVVFLERQLFRLGAGVLLGHVEIARVRGGQKLDLDHRGLGHFSFLIFRHVVPGLLHGGD